MNIPCTIAARRNKARMKLTAHLSRTRNLAAVARTEVKCGDKDLACLMIDRAAKMAAEAEALRKEYAALCRPRRKLLIASE